MAAYLLWHEAVTELHLVFIQLSKLVAPFRLIEPSIIIFKICCFKGSISKSVETWLVLVLVLAISSFVLVLAISSLICALFLIFFSSLLPMVIVDEDRFQVDTRLYECTVELLIPRVGARVLQLIVNQPSSLPSFATAQGPEGNIRAHPDKLIQAHPSSSKLIQANPSQSKPEREDPAFPK